VAETIASQAFRALEAAERDELVGLLDGALKEFRTSGGGGSGGT
jgi:hypothetical protein